MPLFPSRALRRGFALTLGAVLAASGCTSHEPPPATTTVRVTATATATPSPAEPSPTSDAFDDTVQAPFQAVMNLASVAIDASEVTVGGYAAGIAEDGGRCLYTLTSDSTGAVVTAETVGLENVSNTSCGSSNVPMSELHRGTWKVTLTYESDAGSVVSLPLAVEVP